MTYRNPTVAEISEALYYIKGEFMFTNKITDLMWIEGLSMVGCSHAEQWELDALAPLAEDQLNQLIALEVLPQWLIRANGERIDASLPIAFRA